MVCFAYSQTNTSSRLSDKKAVSENDSLLIEQIIKEKNNGLRQTGEYNKKHKFYDGYMLYATDSILKVVNVLGESSEGATYNPFAENVILKNNQIVIDTLSGEVFRIDTSTSNTYKIYVNNYSRLGAHVNVYNLTFLKDRVNLVPAGQGTNYYYNFITRKHTEMNSVMNERKKMTDWNTPSDLETLHINTEELTPNLLYALDEEPFLSTEFYDADTNSPQFLTYFKLVYDDYLEKRLRIINGSSYEEMVLGKRSENPIVNYKMESEFVNDSTFTQTEIITERSLDSSLKLWDSTSTIINTYRYNSQFEFNLLSQDTIHKKELHPVFQKKTNVSYCLTPTHNNSYSKPFTINQINCKWLYKTVYSNSNNQKGESFYQTLIYQSLVTIDNSEIILKLDLNQFLFDFNPIDLPSLKDYEVHKSIKTPRPPYDYGNMHTDVNADGFEDFKFLVVMGDPENNSIYSTYLFNPETNTFEYSVIFSGSNITYNPEKNRIATFATLDANNNNYKYLNLTNDHKTVESEEQLLVNHHTITYKKLINHKVVTEKNYTVKELDSLEHFLERK